LSMLARDIPKIVPNGEALVPAGLAADAALLSLVRTADLLLRAARAKAGYRQHQRGEWRRRKSRNEAGPGDEDRAR
jgi:hypothetical protein